MNVRDALVLILFRLIRHRGIVIFVVGLRRSVELRIRWRLRLALRLLALWGSRRRRQIFLGAEEQ